MLLPTPEYGNAPITRITRRHKRRRKTSVVLDQPIVHIEDIHGALIPRLENAHRYRLFPLLTTAEPYRLGCWDSYSFDGFQLSLKGIE